MLDNIAVVNSNQEGELGHLFWYSIGDDLYNRQDLERALSGCGLSTGFMPRKIRPVDAFRRATKEVETRKNLGGGFYENYIVRDVYSDTAVCVRHIVKEMVDSKGKRLDYNPKEAILTLDRENDSVEINATPGSVAESLGNEAKEYYEVFKKHHNGQAVRSMVQGILKTLSPTPVRPSGGIYFIPSAQTEGLAKLVAFCSSFPKGEGFKVPVVENKESLEMVSTKVADHLEGILEQCQGAMKDEQFTKSRLKDLINEAKSIVGGYKDYEKILIEQKVDMDNRIQLVRESIAMLLDKAR